MSRDWIIGHDGRLHDAAPTFLVKSASGRLWGPFPTAEEAAAHGAAWAKQCYDLSIGAKANVPEWPAFTVVPLYVPGKIEGAKHYLPPA